jgi:hypothetical protein
MKGLARYGKDPCASVRSCEFTTLAFGYFLPARNTAARVTDDDSIVTSKMRRIPCQKRKGKRKVNHRCSRKTKPKRPLIGSELNCVPTPGGG